MIKYSAFIISIIILIQAIIKTFNYCGIYYSLIPTALLIVGSYLFITKQLKNNEKSNV